MTQSSTFSSVLMRAVRFTGRRQMLLAGLAGPMGLFMVSVPFLGIDARSLENTTTLVALYGFGGLFLLVAAYFSYLALLGNAKRGRRLASLLERSPDQLVGVERMIHGINHRIAVKFQQDPACSLLVPSADVNAFMSHIAHHAPHTQRAGR
ncbi:MAG: hypothetical protein AB8I08_29485 [Sandaracinaceae bacterium]